MLELSHKNLEVWKMPKELAKDIYEITGKYPHSEMYVLVNQLRRASVSIISNIAEVLQESLLLKRKDFLK